MRNICHDLQIPVRDVMQVYTSAIDSGQIPFRDKIHLNEYGQKLLMNVLIASLKELDCER